MRSSRGWLAVVLGGCCLLASCGGSSKAAEPAATPIPVPGHWEARLLPPVQAGTVGWCVSFETGSDSSWGCELDAMPGEPILAESWSGSGPPPVALAHALTAANVAAVSLEGVQIPTQARPGLPYGLRAVIVELPGTHLLESDLPGRGLTPLDRSGSQIPRGSKTSRRELLLRQQVGLEPIRSWKRPQAIAQGVCKLSAAGLAGLTPEWGRVVTHLTPAPGMIGDGFISCVDTEFYFDNWPIDAAVLVDAAHPGAARPVAIPNLTPVRGHPGLLSGKAGNGGLLARRVGEAWVVIEGGSGLAQRLEVMAHLDARVSPSAARRELRRVSMPPK
jgi:hypothetical protein